MLAMQSVTSQWLSSRLPAPLPLSSTCPLANVSFVVGISAFELNDSDFQLVHVLWRSQRPSPLLVVVHKYKSMVGRDLLPLLLVNRILEVYASIFFCAFRALAYATTDRCYPWYLERKRELMRDFCMVNLMRINRTSCIP